MRTKQATKFTFKKQPGETGLRSIGNSYPNTDIKLKGLVVGTIDAPTWNTADNKWRASFMVCQEPTAKDPCNFRWVRVLLAFDDERSARRILNEHFEQLLNLGLYAESDVD